MSSPIHLDDDTDPTLIYAPPWARKRVVTTAKSMPRSRASMATASKMGSRKIKPKFSGDRAMLALQRELTVDPDLIPEPLSESAAVIRPLLIRLCSVTALAAFAAWGLVSYSGVKKSTEINASAPTIASNYVAADEQPVLSRPTQSRIAEARTPIAKSQPVAVATADTDVVTSVPTSSVPTSVPGSVPMASPIAETPAPAPEQRADAHRPLPLDIEEIETLVKRGKDLLANGDFAAARLLLRRAAEAGSAEGALTLGTTFDPVVLQRLGAIGAAADLSRARQWYQRAAELGSRDASQQLAGLADAR